jgi:hypothetical protein
LAQGPEEKLGFFGLIFGFELICQPPHNLVDTFIGNNNGL